MAMEKDKIVNQPTESEIEGNKTIERQRPPKDNINDEKIDKKRGRIESLIVYDITVNELDTLTKSSKGSIYLNFAIALLSIAVSFLTALLTNEYADKIITLCVFLIIMIVGFVLGGLLLVLWHREKSSNDDLVEVIKDRYKG